MSALRPHIVAARAYAQAFDEKAAQWFAIAPKPLPASFAEAISGLERFAAVHARAADLMEAEQAAEYAEAARVPPLRTEAE